GGNVACFHPLARRLADVRPVYALEAVGLDGSQPPLRKVEEIAARHIETIWPVAGAGPYYLGGHSFGAAVALEMSHQLIARGATVAKLAIFDSFAPLVIAEHAYWHDWDDVDWLLAISHDLGTFLGTDLELTREDLVKLDPEDQLMQLVKRVMNRDDSLAGAETERLRAYLNVYQANFRTSYTASMTPLPLSIVLYTSTHSDPRDHDPSPEFAALLTDPTRGWGRLSQRPVEVAAVPGTHLSLLVEPNVRTLASYLDEFLQKADA
ncbi:MAG TPA: alpha/beta fold hydrolase, partial [Steroidobacteraceae bacterium]